jgi:hypothetical protein
MTAPRTALCIIVGAPVLAWKALRLAADLAIALLGILLAACATAGERALFGRN